jgi:hypothetical protein
MRFCLEARGVGFVGGEGRRARDGTTMYAHMNK